jgi:chromate reductase, NAD(P)H dehydrogenase (quinone)
MSTYKVGYLIGSLSSQSINRQLSKALIGVAPANLELVEIDISDLPPYNRDLDDDMPGPAQDLKGCVAEVDAVLFITPEYNRDIPGTLKNAIDWASRPYGKNSFDRVPSAVIGASPGAIGTAVAQQNLRGVLSYLNSPQMTAPEAYIQVTEGLITEDGDVTDESTKEFLRTFMEEFATFIERVLTVLPQH